MPHVITRIQRPTPDLVQRFSQLSTATVHEAQGKLGAMSEDIKPIYPGMKVCGPAFTVLGHPGDNLILHKALAIAQPGDVLVVDMGGHTEGGYWGEMMATSAMARGIRGLVINGTVRDAAAMRDMGFPVFAKGISMKGTYKEALGFVNHPISCAGVIVHPGDLVLGDDDGVVVVPLGRLEEVLQKSLARDQHEDEVRRKLAQGITTLELMGLAEVLKRKGLEEE